MTKPLWSLKETAEYLSVHERTVRRWRDEGRLRALRAGRLLRFDPDEVKRFLGTEAANDNNELPPLE